MDAVDDGCVFTPPDGGWGWMVVFASFVIHIIADGIMYTFGIFYVELSVYFGDTKANTAWIASIMEGMTFGAGPLVSLLINMYGCRSVCILGSFVSSFGFIVSQWAPNVQVMYVTLGLILGLGLGLIYLPAIVIVTCYFEKKRAFATGVAVCGSGIGTFIMAPITEHLLTLYGWKQTMMCLGLLLCFCAVFATFFRPLPLTETADSAVTKQNENQRIASTRKAEELDLERSFAGFKRTDRKSKLSTLCFCSCSRETRQLMRDMLGMSLFRDPVFVIFIISNVLTSAGFNVPFIYIVDKAVKDGLGGNQASYLLSVIGISNTLARITLGYVSDRAFINRLYLYNSMVTISGLATLSVVISSDFWSLSVSAAVYGLSFGTYVSLTSVLIVDLFGINKLTNAFGLVLLFQGLSSLVGPPITGALYDSTQSYDAGFGFAGAVIIVSGVILFFVPCLQRYTHTKMGKSQTQELSPI